MWKYDNLVWVYSFSRFHIDTVVNGGTLAAWRFTSFYGEPDTNEREDSWSMLHMLQAKPHLPWCCMGDFNELLHTDEKRGGRIYPHNQMQAFRDVLDFFWFCGSWLYSRNLLGMAEDIVTRCKRDLIEGWQIMIG